MTVNNASSKAFPCFSRKLQHGSFWIFEIPHIYRRTLIAVDSYFCAISYLNACSVISAVRACPPSYALIGHGFLLLVDNFVA